MQPSGLVSVALAIAGSLIQCASTLETQQAPLLPSPDPRRVGRQPNIVFILVDDQDKRLDSLAYMPSVKKHLLEQGTSFENHFCTTAICCPSRVSLWTGKLAHNTNVTDVSPPYGGYPKFVSQGFNNAYLPVWLQNSGYNTYYTGKLFNSHNINNYNSPYPAGWNGSDFLLDPFTYQYLNSTYQHNRDAPQSYEGRHTTEILTEKAYNLLDEASRETRPFFLGIAPIAPHSNVGFTFNPDGTHTAHFTEPIPANRHKNLFGDAFVPRTPNFNPDKPTGASWIQLQHKLNGSAIEYNDHFYRQRLRALQGVDELVDGLFERLAKKGLLDNTYFFYTSDNGFHIGQHRLPPGKECGYEEDINVPLIIRGPGVPANKVTNLVTTHIDLAPTLLHLAQSAFDSTFGFDGMPIPLTLSQLETAQDTRHEHVTVEFWGTGLAEGRYGFSNGAYVAANNTYKALRVVGASGRDYNLYYAVWCDGSRELYDLATDPYQIANLLHSSTSSAKPTLFSVPIQKLVERLDALLLVLKSCQGRTCVEPWKSLHPQGNVQKLGDALSPRFDQFYADQVRVKYDHCESGVGVFFGAVQSNSNNRDLSRVFKADASLTITPSMLDKANTTYQPAIAKAGHGKNQDNDSRLAVQVPLGTPAEAPSDPRIVQIVMVMVLAVFVYNADGSLVLATHTTIASEFDSLESSSWIFTAFGLAGAATQVMLTSRGQFGKLSDVYGRKPVILFCYSVFSIGCLVIGTAESLGTVIIGRIICGSVGAGMGLLVSILLVDIVPIRDLAAWRSYINLAATAGRSAGGPLGGWLADAVGWRWSFLGQVPLFMLASALCLLYLPDTKTAGRNTRRASASVEAGGAGEISEDGKPKAELDLVGALLLGSAILAFLFPVQMGGSLFPWNSAWIPALFAASLVLLGLFITCEARWTSSPLLPLVLFRNREATASFLIMFLQTSAQVSLMFSIPIFFQVVHKSSSSEAGWHLFPAVLGNTLGSILSGMIIQSLLILTWNVPVGWIKSMFVFPGPDYWCVCINGRHANGDQGEIEWRPS
ncbi:Arylsulfatase [Ceratocystis lukuohia]|uniref:Arylsulfatase n=1 Tax=Ceratocystis lukuohia TaxID=2019550 RepID=A0ABR4MRV6_9PEZI